MALHQGLLVDTRARTHRDRQGRVHPVTDLVLAGETLYVAGELPGNPRFCTFRRWLIPDQGWVVGRFAVHPGQRPMAEDWYIDVDAVSVEGHLWRAEDRLLDVSVYEGRRYTVDDADELADCIERGLTSPADAIAALRSLHALCRALERLSFSGAALLAEYAPGLPVPEVSGIRDQVPGSDHLIPDP
jgi:predicted RNA-binding protein associated with RNAse of E/G family